MKVDLITDNRDLEDIMLKDYPDILKEDMFDKKKKGDKTTYSFYGLEKELLTKFLNENEEIKDLGISLDDYVIKESAILESGTISYSIKKKESPKLKICLQIIIYSHQDFFNKRIIFS